VWPAIMEFDSVEVGKETWGGEAYGNGLSTGEKGVGCVDCGEGGI
jgi:hypothetical protein